MQLFYIFPFAKAPYYETPTAPIQAFVLSDDLSEVLDAAELPYAQNEELDGFLEGVLAKHGMPWTLETVQMCRSLGKGVQDEENKRRSAQYLTMDRQKALLAVLASHTGGPISDEEEADLLARMEQTKRDNEAQAAELDRALRQKIKNKFPTVSTDWW